MSLLLETIKLHDGKYFNLSYHEQRINRSLKALCGLNGHFDLDDFLAKIVCPSEGLYKCRLTYDEDSKDMEFMPYVVRDVKTLKVVEHDTITYAYKYADRTLLNKLFERRDACDDILIVKKRLVTDASYANIAFKEGNHWVTPWSPLLKGTMRAYLLERNIIREEQIFLADIATFESFKIFNAMIGFDSTEQPVSNIVL